MRVNVEFSRYTIREIDPDDSWDAGETGIELGGAYVVNDDFYADYNSLEVPDDAKYVVVVKYSHGSTFGSEESFEIVESFVEANDADDFARHIAAKEHEAKGSYQLVYNGREYSTYAWHDYFGGFQDVRVLPINRKRVYK